MEGNSGGPGYNAGGSPEARGGGNPAPNESERRPTPPESPRSPEHPQELEPERASVPGETEGAASPTETTGAFPTPQEPEPASTPEPRPSQSAEPAETPATPAGPRPRVGLGTVVIDAAGREFTIIDVRPGLYGNPEAVLTGPGGETFTQFRSDLERHLQEGSSPWRLKEPPEPTPGSQEGEEQTRELDPEGPGSFRQTAREVAQVLINPLPGTTIREIKNTFFPEIPDEILFPPDGSEDSGTRFLANLYKQVEDIPPVEMERRWREYKRQIEANPAQREQEFRELYQWITREGAIANEQKLRRALEQARGAEDILTRISEGEDLPRDLRGEDTDMKRLYIESVLGKRVADYDKDPAHQPPSVAGMSEETARATLERWEQRRQATINAIREELKSDPEVDRNARENAEARRRRGTDVPGIPPPDDLEQGLVNVRTGYGFPIYIKVWRPKEEVYEGSPEDRRAKFRWVLRKLEEAEQVAAVAESSITQNDTARNILQDVQYLTRYLADNELPAYQELANIIHKEFEARLALYEAHRSFMNAGSIDDAFSAVQNIRTTFFNNYFRGSFDSKGKRMYSYKVIEGGVEKEYGEKDPVRRALAHIDASTKLGLDPNDPKSKEDRAKNYILISNLISGDKENYGRLKQFKRDLALSLADKYLTENEKNQLTEDAKVARFVWAVEMAEKLFIVTTRFGTRDLFEGDPGKAGNMGSDVGALYSTSRINHLYYDYWEDKGDPNGSYDGVAKNSWLNTRHVPGPLFPILMKGIDLQTMDYFTFLASQLKAAYGDERAKELMGWEGGKEDHVAAYYEGKWYKWNEPGFDKAKTSREAKLISWERDLFDLSKIKWDEINFDPESLPSNSFNIKYWLYKQKFVDPIRTKLIGSPNAYLMTPNYDGLKGIKDDLPQFLGLDANVEIKATIFTNLARFLKNGHSRWPHRTWSQEQLDAMYITGVTDGTIVPDKETQKKVLEAMGGDFGVAVRRLKNYFDLWAFIAEIIKQGATTKV